MKERFKNLITGIRTECNTTLLKMRTGDVTAFSRSDRMVFIVTAIITMVIFAAITSHAAGDIIGQVTTQLNLYYGKIFKITTLIAAFLILVAVLWTMLSPSGHSAQTPIAWIKKIVICYIAILSIGGIIALLKEITNGLDYTYTPE